MLNLSRRIWFLSCASALACWLFIGCASTPPAPLKESKWTKEIQAMLDSDATNKPPRNPYLFVGSSSIRLWKTLKEDFAGLPVINRGFGGSYMSDSVDYAGNIILPYKPRMVLIYAGDNDLNDGKSPQQVLADFQALVKKIHAQLPKTKVAYIAVKPSPSRWKIEAKGRETNRLIEEYTRTDKRLAYIDIFTPMLGTDGKPRPELFVKDNLHLNTAGYELWRETVRPFLK